MNQKMKISSLSAAWVRLESVCRTLWDENSSSAVEVQAVVEEFKGEVHRVDAVLANHAEMKELELREHEEDLSAMRRHYEIELTGLKKRLELQETAIAAKDTRIEE